MESLDTIIVNRLACRVENLLDKELQGPALERGPGGVATVLLLIDLPAELRTFSTRSSRAQHLSGVQVGLLQYYC